jgi:hypothetical protein
MAAVRMRNENTSAGDDFIGRVRCKFFKHYHPLAALACVTDRVLMWVGVRRRHPGGLQQSPSRRDKDRRGGGRELTWRGRLDFNMKEQSDAGRAYRPLLMSSLRGFLETSLRDVLPFRSCIRLLPIFNNRRLRYGL